MGLGLCMRNISLQYKSQRKLTFQPGPDRELSGIFEIFVVIIEIEICESCLSLLSTLHQHSTSPSGSFTSI